MLPCIRSRGTTNKNAKKIHSKGGRGQQANCGDQRIIHCLILIIKHNPTTHATAMRTPVLLLLCITTVPGSSSCYSNVTLTSLGRLAGAGGLLDQIGVHVGRRRDEHGVDRRIVHDLVDGADLCAVCRRRPRSPAPERRRRPRRGAHSVSRRWRQRGPCRSGRHRAGRW